MKQTGYLDMELLRFTTAGSVDDGKSTLIGRLLYDSKSIFEDQLEDIEICSRRRGNDEVNLALLTDGLRSEREQGITIDVAYRYFATPKRKFIIADTPGHVQYTRNMVTGASTADLAIILIDARNGILEQTIRHSYIAALLGIPRVVACVNKMDLVDFAENTFEEIKNNYQRVAERLEIKQVTFLPISAKLGDNVVTASANMNWYKGPTLMEILENTPLDREVDTNTRLPVQHVIRPISDQFHDFRGYAGRLSGGILRKGDPVTIFPSGLRSTITAISRHEQQLDKAFTPESITVQLADDIDVSRGDLIAGDGDAPLVEREVTLMICWFNERPAVTGNRYIVMQATRETVAILKTIHHVVNINTLEPETGQDTLRVNDIARVTIKTAKPLVFDPYAKNRVTGSLILVDPDTFETVGGGMILSR
ncbi:MAG: GTP-binding protein [Odoribacteraceae bacterium]|jgi:sulfate adenylyltransferase subunit 1|nr:GTP-binding protein [Odoribacteraceae bacterium]